MSISFQEHLKTYQQAVEKHLQDWLVPHLPEKLWEAMAYSVLDGGKRIRPVLTLLTAEALGAEPQQAMAAGCALELIHVYSLIHDDLPSLDNDDWRRGKPSNHKQFSEALAILTGDALQAYAFEVISCYSTDVEPAVVLQLVQELARSIGPAGMCAGQVLDMRLDPKHPLTADNLERMYALKTGQLLRASVRMGALIGKASPEQLNALTEYAEQLGLAFQLVDDILDLTGSLATLGKTPQKDLHQEKTTYTRLYGLDPARQRTRDCLAQASRALQRAQLPHDQWLKAMIDYLGQRQT